MWVNKDNPKAQPAPSKEESEILHAGFFFLIFEKTMTEITIKQ